SVLSKGAVRRAFKCCRANGKKSTEFGPFLHDSGWAAVDPKPSSNHADKLATRSSPEASHGRLQFNRWPGHGWRKLDDSFVVKRSSNACSFFLWGGFPGRLRGGARECRRAADPHLPYWHRCRIPALLARARRL